MTPLKTPTPSKERVNTPGDYMAKIAWAQHDAEEIEATRSDVGTILVTGLAIAAIALAVVFIFIPAIAHFLRSVMM